MRNIITPPSLLQQPYLVDGGQDSMTNVITDDDGCEFHFGYVWNNPSINSNKCWEINKFYRGFISPRDLVMGPRRATLCGAVRIHTQYLFEYILHCKNSGVAVLFGTPNCRP